MRVARILTLSLGLGIAALAVPIDSAEAASRSSAMKACNARATHAYPRAHAYGASRNRAHVYTACMRRKGFRA
ncbi:hypothetical protein [Chelatococcus reniformis]|uniref:Phosphate starvation-inducible protein PsiF n=1 Tax=Chelatococcus reniformis TaxID=1494448 RepID=A0A916UKS0_9HYPH|nr:hypothetical protein [Chelatococcus reniformis]GGC76790.1 hypothetical protein GCM10010994_38860 [Chelatococcus reniformis]